jgi:hypothetical protein
VYVQEGRIVSSRVPGMAKDDPLLAFLRKVHRLSDEQLRGLLTIQRESNRDLEDLLLNGRYLDAEDLASYVERQILDDLMRLVRWENGTYRFDPNNRYPNTPLVRLNIEGAMIEAARRVDEQKRFVQVFKDPHQLVGVRDLPDPEEPLSDEERELFGIVDGQHTVAEVVERAPLSEYECYEALHRMLDAGWIEFVGRRDPGVPAAMGPTHRAAPRRVSPLREVVVIGAALALAAGLRLGADAVAARAPGTVAADAHAVARQEEIRLALELHRRERGSYPDDLEALVNDRWVAPDQVRLRGYRFRYHSYPGGYELALLPDR